MSTPTVTPTTPVAWVVTQTWFQKHERIIIALIALSLGVWGFNKWVDKSANDAKAQVAIAQQAQATQDASVKALQAQLAQQSAQFAQSQTEMKTEILSLVSAIAQRDAATQSKVIEVTKPKTPTQAVVDLQQAYPKLPDAPVVTDAGATVTTADVQQFTVAKIEGDAAKADLDDTKTELTKTNDSLTQAVSLLGAKDNVITGLQTDIKTHDATCKTEKDQIKADARKGKWHSFLAGAATVGVIALKFMKF